MSRSPTNGSSRQKPRTYAEACAELGDQPWRKLEGTEQWFLADEEEASGDQESGGDREPEPVTLDTSAFIIPRSGWLPKLSGTTWLLVGGVMVTLALVFAALPNARLIVAASQANPPPVAVAAPPVAVAAPPVAVAAPPIAVAARPVAVAAPPVATHERPIKKAPLRDRRRARRRKH